MRSGGVSKAAAGMLGALLAATLGACSSSPTPSSPPSTPVPSASLLAPGPTPTATQPLVAGAHWRGAPSSFGTPGGHAAGVAWTADDTLLYVVLWGSSSCPPVAVSPATRTGEASVAVVRDRDRYGGRVCTADAAPATTVVALPPGITPGEPLAVLVDGLGPVRLVAAADADDPVWVEGS